MNPIFLICVILSCFSLQATENKNSSSASEIRIGWYQDLNQLSPAQRISSICAAKNHLKELRQDTTPEGKATYKMWFRYYYNVR